MGRSNPTFRRLLEQFRTDWQAYRRALKQDEQDYFDTLCEHAHEHADAAGYQNPHRPMDAIVLSILLEQQKTITSLKQRLEE